MKPPRLHAIAAAVALLVISIKSGAAETMQPIKDPLSYPLKQYGLMLGTALLGGLVSWYAKVRKGELAGASITQLIGELCTSAFAGLLTFWGCEAAGMSPLLTAALVGIAGHMGTRAIAWAEETAKRRFGGNEPEVHP